MRDWLNLMTLPDDFFVSINLSPTQLTTETLLNDMRALVRDHRGLARHLKLEITESQVMTNPEHSAFMLAALKGLGVGLALDDFGTGHSSLSYLHRFPIDTIKIPAPFVQISDDSGLAHTQVPIIRSIVALAADLGITVIGEGVENLEEIDRLRELGCTLAQGFAFGGAMNAIDLQKKLMAQSSRGTAAVPALAK
jgi:EAL domain-containing protein (putative c-di-GMP-specific phosphodiesterase class I)